MNIAVVLVTFNRLECLKIALDKFEKQTFLPKRMLVINNNSTDGTTDFLNQWVGEEAPFEKVVINSQENLGGAGGFALGMRSALEYDDTDWVWVSDDDAYPDSNALEELRGAYLQLEDKDDVSALFAAVVNNEKFALSHRRRVEKSIRGVRSVNISEREYQQPYFLVDQGSYVGMLVKSEELRKVGVTREEFFIYYDDTEHSERIGKGKKMYCVPAAKIVHDVANDSSVNWKNYYGFRNSIILLNTHYGRLYGMIEYLKRYILFVSIFNKTHSKDIKKLLGQGLKDGMKGEVGLHPLYKPGWEPKDK